MRDVSIKVKVVTRISLKVRATAGFTKVMTRGRSQRGRPSKAEENTREQAPGSASASICNERLH